MPSTLRREQVFDNDRELIMSKNSAALSTIMKVAIRLSGLEEERLVRKRFIYNQKDDSSST